MSPCPDLRRWGARAPQQADTQAAATHANPCLQVRAWPISTHTPLQNCVLPSFGPPRTQPHGPTPKDWREGGGRGRPGSRVRAATASGRSRQPGLRPEGESSRSEETAGPSRPSRARPGPRGASVPDAPQASPPPPPHLRPGSPREPGPAGGPRARPELLFASPTPEDRVPGPRRGSRELPGPGGLEVRGK